MASQKTRKINEKKKDMKKDSSLKKGWGIHTKGGQKTRLDVWITEAGS